MNEKIFDYIVIGAGTTGCVIASRLSENSNRNVLVLETRDRDKKLAFHNSDIEWTPGVKLTTKQELRDYIQDYCFTEWHPTSTCKMGRDVMSVVDPQLRVYGIEGLRVADASIMPTITSGNPNASCPTIGEKASAMIVQG